MIRNKTKYIQLQSNQQVKDYEVTEKTFNDKKHLIVPVVMIVEGVLNGSHGPLLHKAEDFGKIPESWNGIPVVINHPEEEGHSISANSPDVIERQSVGVIYNSHMSNNRLLAECWLDSEKLGKVSGETLIAVNDGNTIEISVGVYTEDEAVLDGNWNGIKYNAIAKNHRPDHLALLPGGVGACSVKDGCGIRANEKKKGGKSVDRLEAIQVLKGLGQLIPEIGDNMAQGLKEKLDELYELVRSKNIPSNTKGLDGVYCYLEEAFDTYLIYSEDDGKDRKTFKQNYQFNVTSGNPEFVGEAIEVEKKIEYKELKTNADLIINSKEKEMERTKCTPCVEKKASALIANKATKWTEEDQEYLQTLEESVLDRMIPEEVTVEVEKPVVNALSPEDQAALDYGKKMLAEKKKKMAEGIQKNSAAGTWTDPELLAMKEDMLEKIWKSSVKADLPVDFSLQANISSPVSNAGDIAPLMPIV